MAKKLDLAELEQERIVHEAEIRAVTMTSLGYRVHLENLSDFLSGTCPDGKKKHGWAVGSSAWVGDEFVIYPIGEPESGDDGPTFEDWDI